MDPRTSWIINDAMLLDAVFYRRQLDKVRSDINPIPEITDRLLGRVLESERQERELNIWLPFFEDYIDQFMAELCLDLRRGKFILL